MMHKIFLLPLLLCLAFQSFGQKEAKRYKKIINYSYDSTLIYEDGTPGYIFLKNAKGQHILQVYNYSTGKVYKHMTFKDKDRSILHGPMVWLDDQGNLYEKGRYVNGLRAGIWRKRYYDEGYTEGPYVNNQKDGPWSFFDTQGIKTREDLYDRDTIKKVIFFNPDGTEKDTTIADEKLVIKVIPEFICDNKYEKNEDCSGKSLKAFIWNNLNYPKGALETGIQGEALFSFVVDKDGAILDVRTINGICNEIESEGIRLINSMPAWKPGTVDGVPVKVMFTLPLYFRLN